MKKFEEALKKVNEKEELKSLIVNIINNSDNAYLI